MSHFVLYCGVLRCVELELTLLYCGALPCSVLCCIESPNYYDSVVLYCDGVYCGVL